MATRLGPPLACIGESTQAAEVRISILKEHSGRGERKTF
jgi:hypothetical protein